MDEDVFEVEVHMNETAFVVENHMDEGAFEVEKRMNESAFEVEKYMNEEVLKLENQLCFPLYVCAKEVIRKYQPFLEGIDLTYTQYITMMVLWEKKQISVKELGEQLYLDSGTLTPMLKKIEAKGFIRRERSKVDERLVIVSLLEKGEQLKKASQDIPMKIGSCIKLNRNDVKELHRILHSLLDSFK